jgi:hypothetical protein
MLFKVIFTQFYATYINLECNIQSKEKLIQQVNSPQTVWACYASSNLVITESQDNLLTEYQPSYQIEPKQL